MKKILLIFVISLTLIQSCDKKENNTNSGDFLKYSGKKIIIQYDNTKINKIYNNDYFVFDGHKMTHRDDFLQSNEPYTLPSSNPILVEKDKKILEEKMNIISMAVIFANKIAPLNKYNFINLKQTNINGKLTIERKDGKIITIEKLKSYPVFVDVIE